ncbi:MAG: SDR family oxidoreductase [Planctomycetes bacterium]|nr:SDR family oxidoreductase [Planctomycetota bacterium]
MTIEKKKPSDFSHVALITGFPGFIAGHLLKRLLKKEDHFFYLLSIQPMAQAAESYVSHLSEEARSRIEIVVGDICFDTLGMDTRTRVILQGEITDIYHLAALYNLAAKKEVSMKINVDGTRNVLDFAGGCARFRRLIYFSTCYVAGRRTGIATEDECDVGQTFKNFYEETKCLAEEIVRERWHDVQTSIIRPGIVAGDSKTGEINKYDGPYYTIRSMVAMERHGKIGRARMFAVRGKDVPIYIVPVDFIIDATEHISFSPEGAGKAFALVERNPVTVQGLLQQLFNIFHLETPWWRLPVWSFRLAFLIPGVSKAFQVPTQALDYLDHDLRFDNTNLEKILAGSNIRCPRAEEYVRTMVDYVRAHPNIPANLG